MVPLFIDHDVTNVIVQGVIDYFSEVDLIRAQDVGLADADDNLLLEWAAAHRRLMVSSDTNTMIAAANERLFTGLPMPGLVVVRQSLEYRIAIEDLAAIALCSEPDEWNNKVTFLPLVQ